MLEVDKQRKTYARIFAHNWRAALNASDNNTTAKEWRKKKQRHTHTQQPKRSKLKRDFFVHAWIRLDNNNLHIVGESNELCDRFDSIITF